MDHGFQRECLIVHRLYRFEPWNAKILARFRIWMGLVMPTESLDKTGSAFQKKSYKPPRLLYFGDVRHLTQAASQGTQSENSNGLPTWKKVRP